MTRTNKPHTHTLLPDKSFNTHTHGLPCRKLLGLLEVAGTARATRSCWNFCSCVDRDCVCLPELLAIEEAAGTSARASIETASGCRNYSRLAAGTACVWLLLVLAFGCCSCLWNLSFGCWNCLRFPLMMSICLVKT